MEEWVSYWLSFGASHIWDVLVRTVPQKNESEFNFDFGFVLYILVYTMRFAFSPISSYTWVSWKKLVSDNRYNLFHVSVRMTHVSTKQFNLICQWQFCILICFIRCFKNINLLVPAIINNLSLIRCLSS